MERRVGTRRRDGELVVVEGYRGPVGYAVILPEGEWRDGDRYVEEPTPCLLDCDDPDCREWPTLWTVAGENRRQAMGEMMAGRWTGALYHVSECQMSAGK